MHPETAPFFSVIIPAYNAAQTVVGTLDSVISQTWRDLEIIVIDDGSTDSTAALIKDVAARTDLSLKMLEGAHLGAGAARNQGIIKAQGEWVAFLDADDLWEPNKLAAVAEIIKAQPEIGLICHSQTEYEVKTDRKRLLDPSRKCRADQPFFLELYRGNFLLTSALIIRRSILLDAGLFDNSLPSAQDYDLWLKVSVKAEPYFIKRTLGWYRITETGITANLSARLTDNLRIAQRYRNWLPRYTNHPRWTYLKRYFKSLSEVVRVALMRRAFGQLPAILAVFIGGRRLVEPGPD